MRDLTNTEIASTSGGNWFMDFVSVLRESARMQFVGQPVRVPQGDIIQRLVSCLESGAARNVAYSNGVPVAIVILPAVGPACSGSI